MYACLVDKPLWLKSGNLLDQTLTTDSIYQEIFRIYYIKSLLKSKEEDSIRKSNSSKSHKSRTEKQGDY